MYHHSYSYCHCYYYNFIELLKLLCCCFLSDFPVMNRLVLMHHMCKLSFTLREGTGLMNTT